MLRLVGLGYCAGGEGGLLAGLQGEALAGGGVDFHGAFIDRYLRICVPLLHTETGAKGAQAALQCGHHEGAREGVFGCFNEDFAVPQFDVTDRIGVADIHGGGGVEP